MDKERGWKLIFMLPRMLFHKVGSGTISRSKLHCLRVSPGEIESSWQRAKRATVLHPDDGDQSGRRQPRDDIAHRATRVELLVQLEALEGAVLAPATVSHCPVRCWSTCFPCLFDLDENCSSDVVGLPEEGQQLAFLA